MDRVQIENKYDEFLGTGLWEQDYKKHIVEFACQCVSPESFGYFTASEVARMAGCSRQYVNKIKDQLVKIEFEGKYWYKPFELNSL
tara:strand:- start:142 stop:399 length:258 start_codon:yes stop_codon:yes gene_type:complete